MRHANVGLSTNAKAGTASQMGQVTTSRCKKYDANARTATNTIHVSAPPTNATKSDCTTSHSPIGFNSRPNQATGCKTLGGSPNVASHNHANSSVKINRDTGFAAKEMGSIDTGQTSCGVVRISVVFDNGGIEPTARGAENSTASGAEYPGASHTKLWNSPPSPQGQTQLGRRASSA